MQSHLAQLQKMRPIPVCSVHVRIGKVKSQIRRQPAEKSSEINPMVAPQGLESKIESKI